MTQQELEQKKHSLEVMKVILSVFTPILVLIFGLIVNSRLESQKQVLQEAQLREQKIDLIQKIVPEIIDKGESRNSIMMGLLKRLDTAIAREIEIELIKNIKTATLSNDTTKTENILQTAKSIGGAISDTIQTIAAKDYEKKGLEALLNKDIDAAIVNFSKAEGAYPTFHQASELNTLLNSNKKQLNDTSSKHWKKIYSTVVKDYSWEMPQQYKKLMISKTDDKPLNIQ